MSVQFYSTKVVLRNVWQGSVNQGYCNNIGKVYTNIFLQNELYGEHQIAASSACKLHIPVFLCLYIFLKLPIFPSIKKNKLLEYANMVIIISFLRTCWKFLPKIVGEVSVHYSWYRSFSSFIVIFPCSLILLSVIFLAFMLI